MKVIIPSPSVFDELNATHPRFSLGALYDEGRVKLVPGNERIKQSPSVYHTLEDLLSAQEVSSSARPRLTTQQAVHSVLQSRKVYRVTKGREEPVWPPKLEAALLEGECCHLCIGCCH